MLLYTPRLEEVDTEIPLQAPHTDPISTLFRTLRRGQPGVAPELVPQAGSNLCSQAHCPLPHGLRLSSQA